MPPSSPSIPPIAVIKAVSSFWAPKPIASNCSETAFRLAILAVAAVISAVDILARSSVMM